MAEVMIAIGASAGGIEALVRLVGGLPANLQAAVTVVVHVPSTATSALPRILNRAGPLPAAQAIDGDSIESGQIYVAAPGHHLLVMPGRLRVTRGPRENGHRPAIDTLFTSTASAFGRNAIGVVLSGANNDGALGLAAIKAAGGIAVVQDPADALVSEMPRSARDAVAADHVAPAAELGPLLASLVARQFATQEAGSMSGERNDLDDAEVQADKAAMETGDRSDQPSMLTCPDCGGVLWELGSDKLLHYRCHVGHAYSAEVLQLEQASALETALWTAVRALDESASLARRLAHRARGRGLDRAAARFAEQALEHERRAAIVLELVKSPSSARPESE